MNYPNFLQARMWRSRLKAIVAAGRAQTRENDPSSVIESVLSPGILGEYTGAPQVVAQEIIEALNNAGFVIKPGPRDN